MDWITLGIICLIAILGVLNFITNCRIKILKDIVKMIDESCRQCFNCQSRTNEQVYFIIKELQERIDKLEQKKCKCEPKKENKKQDKKEVNDDKRDGTR